MRDAGPRAADEEQGLQSYLSMARLLVGWAGLGFGALNLLMGLVSAPYVIFHGVVLATGGVLLSAGALRRRPGRIAWPTGLGVALAGLLISSLPRTPATFCCMSEFDKRHGFPFTVLAQQSGHWQLDGARLLADLFFWACVGTLVLFALTAVTPAPRSVPRPAPEPPPSTARHAEPRPETVDDENVRGLP
ncbi:hypothetical protein GCM10010172_24410 [Paractinoplanes ferrugineus]|uniref:Uncharacterized protein n=1 Tax=Paractinoplanes ferrugineus TaxID=113564 RepID=A0A919IV22_9ACTN|nr:hypothetical protein [Actinoplanes ferrugineus]GIE08648.1 hypothetical protein Afe05nite_04880 [Actinoplanes ferrugineus]